VDAWLHQFAGRPVRARIAERLTGLPTRLQLGRAATWLFNSEYTRWEALEAGWSFERSKVAHPGIDHGLFRPVAPKEWGWKRVSVGRIDPRKGIGLAVRTLPLLPAEAALDVVGNQDDSAHLEELRELARELGVAERVSFRTVRRTALPQVYADSDVLVFPVLWWEPWGLVPLESMAVGRPVVTSGRGGQAEYARDGENCLVADPKAGPAALAEAITRLANSPELRDRLVSEGPQTAAPFTEAAYNRAIAGALEQSVR
jgi:glycosyltransferase involved in cell wall biosynthesis